MPDNAVFIAAVRQNQTQPDVNGLPIKQAFGLKK